MLASAARECVKQIPGAVRVVRSARRIFSPARLPQAAFHPGQFALNFTPSYNEARLATDHLLTTNDKFELAYARALSLGLSNGLELKWRAHVTCWAASIGAKLGGAFVECGVNRGFHSRIICDYLDHVPNFYLLDTYKGFDQSTLSQAQIDNIKAWFAASGRTGDWQRGIYDECYDDTVANSQNAARSNSRKQTKRAATADRCSLHAITEVAREYIAG
jgi:hypothetical protein